MELKDTLLHPFSEADKMAFIAKQNLNGYEVKYTDTAIEAWGKTEKEKIKDMEEQFKKHFFEIPTVGTIFKGGWYRKQPKGYSSATESINTAFNLVNMMGALPKDSLIFYTKPDFSDEEQCSEEWLIAHQFRNDAWSKEDFAQFYYAFVTGWNAQEHA